MYRESSYGRSDNHHYDSNHNVDNPDNHTIYNDHNDGAYRYDDHTLTPDESRRVPPVSIFRPYLQRIRFGP
ncbi:uncharacterized protein Z519_07012 [Cladophialophora bantiana CBS 173.52]|uniref:Uncharacterized protein n=1 Tax=Cladophialophora bantiana (strain ATCC 10958 / CBS 173.52 / CDC B-1940 / NIH 8579) TaxID=1442370 RepID=A0A0D2HMP8_CLAB1|nr:uncharacterized protein Z519_07012 [Cladophialophora bantiana CBS 173.52]KIW92030.1 hypothetical protein Z519_07012 [Cladophialophora bantiana CBS 173.52]